MPPLTLWTYIYDCISLQGCMMLPTLKINPSHHYKAVNSFVTTQPLINHFLLLYIHIPLSLTHWYSFLRVISVKVSGPWGCRTLLSPSDRWITMDSGTEEVSSAPRFLHWTSVNWPGWSSASYLEQHGAQTGKMHHRTWSDTVQTWIGCANIIMFYQKKYIYIDSCTHIWVLTNVSSSPYVSVCLKLLQCYC